MQLTGGRFRGTTYKPGNNEKSDRSPRIGNDQARRRTEANFTVTTPSNVRVGVERTSAERLIPTSLGGDFLRLPALHGPSPLTSETVPLVDYYSMTGKEQTR